MSTHKDPYDMSDDELEQAFLAATAERDGTDPNTAAQESEVGVKSFETDESDDSLEEFDTDADTDADTDSNEAAAEEEETSETEDAQEEQETDQDEAETSDNTAQDSKKTEEESSGPEKLVFAANGEKYEFTEEEMKKAFPRVFGQAMDYTKKLQAIAPWRRTIDALEKENLSHQDINLMIDVLKGDKEAIASVLQRNNIDTLDINTDNVNYVQKEYGRSQADLAIADVIDSISRDREYDSTYRILTKDWDDASWAALASDPHKIQLLHNDVKSGMYERLQPEANKLKVFDGARKSDMDYYIEAARLYYQNEEIQKQATRLAGEQERQRKQAEQTQINLAAQAQARREATRQDASRRQAAAPTGRSVARATVTNYLDASDEDFNEWYNKLQQ